jgi:hypothetical protein
MLVFSDAKITLRPAAAPGDPPRVRVEGRLSPYEPRIEEFFRELGVRKGTVRLRGGRWIFSGEFGEFTAQRVRNFLQAECPVKK